MKIVAGTDPILGNYSDAIFQRLVALCKASLARMQPHEGISGMASYPDYKRESE
jgi:hypothetical protein